MADKKLSSFIPEEGEFVLDSIRTYFPTFVLDNSNINTSYFNQAVTLGEIKSWLINLIYPVGSYYWSSESADPSTLFGGNWQRVKDRFVLAAGDKFIKNYQPVYSGDNEGDLYPVSFSSFRVGDKNIDGGVFSDSTEGRDRYISKIKNWSPGVYYYNNKPYHFVALSWYRYYDYEVANRIELIGLRYDIANTWEPLGLSSNLYIYMSDGSVYIITPNMLSNGVLYPDQTTNNYGGEETVSLTISEMPEHAHGANTYQYTQEGASMFAGSGSSTTSQVINTNTSGGSQPHNNMPPYEIAYCWRRIPDPVEISSI